MRLPKKTKPYHLKDYKFNLIISVVALTILGILVIGSAQKSVQNKQIIGLVLGLIVMVIVSLIDYVWVLNLYWMIYAINIVMLVITLIFGTEVNGAKRWINLYFTNFQPSELTKILMVLFFAKFLLIYQFVLLNINNLSTLQMLLNTYNLGH